MISDKELKNLIYEKYGKNDLVLVQNLPKDQPSRDYKIRDYKGNIGFISSMTDHFCSNCSRLRLLADGNLKTCLFGRQEYDLLQMIRENKSEEEIIEVIKKAIYKKKFSHDGMFDMSEIANNDKKNRPMIRIGG
jgi:molybdenum cofactor biosynthesis enzyme MoaA